MVVSGGDFRRSYLFLCRAFPCSFDIALSKSPPEQCKGSRHQEWMRRQLQENSGDDSCDPGSLESQFKQLVPHVHTEGHPTSAVIALSEPVISLSLLDWFIRAYWQEDDTLYQCGCAAIGGCDSAGGHWAKALQALIGGKPSAELQKTVEKILRVHSLDNVSKALPSIVASSHPLDDLPVAKCKNGLELQFDVGVHIRTMLTAIEDAHALPEPCRNLSKSQDIVSCDMKWKQVENNRLARRFLSNSTWTCLDYWLKQAHQSAVNSSKKHSSEVIADRPLSIFLATDNVFLRPALVRRLARYGNVYYNDEEVAHVLDGGAKNAAAPLQSLAELYLLSKAHVVLGLGKMLSTFFMMAGALGNSTTMRLREGLSLERCQITKRKLFMKAVWPSDDPRARVDALFG